MDVKTLCLGILNRGDATGYEIKKACEDGPFGHFHAAGFGSIYPALNALCRDGLVSVTEEAQEKRPDKKVYRITSAGRLSLIDSISEEPGNDRLRSDFWFTLFFSHLLQPRQLDAVIEKRIATRRRKLSELEQCNVTDAQPGERFVYGWGLAVMQAEIAYLENNRHELLGEILKAETVARPRVRAEAAE